MRKITLEDEIYPEKLKNIKKPPNQLYCNGNIELFNMPAIAIIGSRCCSEYGVKMAEKFSKQLSENGFCIVSGMATGIDSVAHKACLEVGGKTIAVLGDGLDKIFPKENIYLYKEIIYNNGLVISEYEPETEANSKLFVERNRIVSGLSIGTLVIESAYRSGTSITARYSLEQGKKVFCIPHMLETVTGIGNNRLIQEGCKLVTCVEDILCEFNMLEKDKQEEICKIEISDEYKPIYEILTYNPIPLNDICKKLKCKISDISSMITLMEMEGLVQVVPGNMIKRKG